MKATQALAEEALKRIQNRYLLINVLARYIRMMPTNSDALLGAGILDGILPPDNKEKATIRALQDLLEDKIKFRANRIDGMKD